MNALGAIHNVTNETVPWTVSRRGAIAWSVAAGLMIASAIISAPGAFEGEPRAMRALGTAFTMLSLTSLAFHPRWALVVGAAMALFGGGLHLYVLVGLDRPDGSDFAIGGVSILGGLVMASIFVWLFLRWPRR